MKCWYDKAKKKERAATKVALKDFIAKMREEAVKEAGKKAAEQKQSESEESKSD